MIATREAAAAAVAVTLRRRARLASKPTWRQLARPEQLVPLDSAAPVVFIRGGRGSGKSRTGAETLAEWIRTYPPGEWGIVAPTFADGRDTCVESPSGLFKALGPLVDHWNRSIGELVTTTGHTVRIDGADDGALRVQGKNLRGLWGDEVGLWRRWQLAWDESIAFAVRMEPARIVLTGTPKQGHGLVKRLLHETSVVSVLMRTEDNAANLSEDALAKLRQRYGGTRIGRQELEGEFLEDIPGALWSLAMIDGARLAQAPAMKRVVVAIDPSGSGADEADEVGIVVCGIGHDGDGYVLADRSGHYTPQGWARVALSALEEYRADRIVAEVNYGGQMVINTVRMLDSSAPVKAVTASRGKAVRAEPIAALYEQGRIHHVGAYTELEDQMTTWTPDSPHSPDRLDALVWALTELFIVGAKREMTAY